MSDGQILEDVRSWLDRHGYVLEMEVARELIPHCRYVEQGVQYIDPVMDKLRETDILCSWGSSGGEAGVYHTVTIVIECKSTTAPWIAFFGGSEDVEPALFPYLLRGKKRDCLRCDEIEFSLLNLGSSENSPSAYSVMEKKSDKSTRDHAREGVLAVTSASIAQVRESEQYVKASPVHYSLTVFPLVVTRSPLVSCSLNDSGEVILSHLDSCWVSSKHEKWDTPVRVLVITSKAFKEFAAGLGSLFSEFGMK